MNTNTKDNLVELIRCIQQLAVGVQLHVGLQTTAEVLQAAENAIRALQKDETIIEPR